MCAIFGSSSKEKIEELAVLNSSRGQHSYSVAGYNPSGHIAMDIFRAAGEFNSMILDEISAPYYICHIQAPTTNARDSSAIHPADDRGDLLWHNGIIKDSQVKEWQDWWKENWEWDTQWLLYNLNAGNDISDELSSVDGGFACVWYHKYSKYLRIWRNEFTPMFIDEDFNISSTKADGMIAMDPNVMFEMDFNLKSLSPIRTFKTKNNPYFFGA